MAAEAQGERLSEEELSSMVALLFVTGHETVVNLLGNGALVLMQHPEQLACLLADNSDAAWDAAVEELLRFDGPVETSTTLGAPGRHLARLQKSTRRRRARRDHLGQPRRTPIRLSTPIGSAT
ncbi:MAG: hypothetical protein R2856_25420 [Caldilineaceae bacterium]